ncbi:hypothetical protein [Amycolatopsis minnesotensis]|uniref:DUF8017 domain-containing protein n=1 Tax=Amycolatopsis minnesotensis TaxID=337894 RepID=A0ABN2SWF4_9PSEU
MAWGRRRSEPGGYEDNAALDGVGGYQPADGSSPAPAAQPRQTPDLPARGDATPGPYSSPYANPRGPRPSKSKAPIIGLVVVLLCLGLGFFVTRMARSSSEDSAATPTTTRTPYTPPPQVVVPPAVPGWQSVAGGKGAYAYDVPPSWEPKPGTVHGWEKDAAGPGLSLATSAFVGKGYCPSDASRTRGGSGVTPVAQHDYVRAAAETAELVAKYDFTAKGGPPPTVTVAPPVPVEVDFGGGKSREGSMTLADVVPAPGGDPCLGPKGLVGVVAIKPADNPSDGAVVLVVHTDQGYQGETPREQVVQILKSYRAVPASKRTTITPASR